MIEWSTAAPPPPHHVPAFGATFLSPNRLVFMIFTRTRKYLKKVQLSKHDPFPSTFSRFKMFLQVTDSSHRNSSTTNGSPISPASRGASSPLSQSTPAPDRNHQGERNLQAALAAIQAGQLSLNQVNATFHTALKKLQSNVNQGFLIFIIFIFEIDNMINI